jgi:hypothetical protein
MVAGAGNSETVGLSRRLQSPVYGGFAMPREQDRRNLLPHLGEQCHSGRSALVNSRSFLSMFL